jgi:hypothetical protein
VDIDLRGPRLTTQPRDFTTRESLRHERLKAKWRRVFKNDRIINEGEHAKLETENAEHVRFVDSAGEIVRDACASTRHVEQNGVENFGSVLCSVCRTEGILLTDLAVLSKRKRTRNTLIAPDSLASGCWEDTLHPKETGHMENGYPCDTVARDGAAQQLGGESLYTANHKPARRGRRLLSAQKRPELFSNIHKSRVGIVCCYVCRVAVHLDCYFLASVDCNRWKCDRCSTRAYHASCVLCPNRAGALLQCKDGGSANQSLWAHVSCAVCLPETTLEFESRPVVVGLSSIGSARRKLRCKLCKTNESTPSKGYQACIQCAYKSCVTAFHVSCAFKGAGMVLHGDSWPNFYFCQCYCARHDPHNQRRSLPISDEPLPDCTPVWAKYSRDKRWYPAKIVSYDTNKEKYTVLFEDGYRAILKRNCLWSLLEWDLCRPKHAKVHLYISIAVC